MKYISIFSVIILQGCMVAGIGAGIGAVKYADAQKQNSQTACKDSYSRYLDTMNRLKQKPITLDEYCE